MTDKKRSKPKAYTAWRSLILRHQNGKIILCGRWRKFANFLKDVGPAPSLSHHIMRLPTITGTWGPGRCKWVPHAEVTWGRVITIRGVTGTLKQIRVALGIPKNTLRKLILRLDAAAAIG